MGRRYNAIKSYFHIKFTVLDFVKYIKKMVLFHKMNRQFCMYFPTKNFSSFILQYRKAESKFDTMRHVSKFSDSVNYIHLVVVDIDVYLYDIWLCTH